MALAVAMVACQGATPKEKTPVVLGGMTLSDMSFSNFVAGTDTAAARTVTLTSSHFRGTNLKYDALSSNERVATATATGSVVTVTPKGAGTATVTVIATATADDEEGTESLTFTVTVAAPTPPEPPEPPEPPPDNNAPRLKAGKTLPHHTDLLYGGSREVDLSEYFTDDEGDAITYEAVPNDEEVVTTSVSGSMLTITVVNHGDATITVTATDSYNQSRKEAFDVTVINQAPMKTDENTHFGPYSIGHEQSFDLTDFFTDIEGDSLTYEAESNAVTVATVTDPGTGSMITIEAVAAGKAEITVIANDGANDSAPNILTVTVSAVPNEVPTVTTGIMDMTLNLMVMDMMESASKTFDLANHFDDPDDRPMPLTYSDDSDMTTIEGSMLTITADESDSGSMTTITVTATDGEDEASETFDVTVNAPDAPTWKKEIPDPPAFAHDGADKTYMLEDYFRNATMYDATTNPNGVVDAMVSGATLTLSVEGPGTTTVEITPSNSRDDGVTQSITVTVMEVPVPEQGNMPPETKPGMMLPDLRIQIVSEAVGGVINTGDDFSEGDTTDNHTIEDLNEYFRDPDGVLLFFKVEKVAGSESLTDTDGDVTETPVIDLHSIDPVDADDAADDAAADGMPPNFELGAKKVIIEPLNPGSVTVRVTAKDINDDIVADDFMVTVVASDTNMPPTATGADGATDTPAETVPDLTGDADIVKVQPDTPIAALRRLTTGETRKVLADTLIEDLFSDPDLDRSERRDERLTLSVKYFPLSVDINGVSTPINAIRAADPATKELAADKVRVTHTLSVNTWNGSPTAKLTFSLTAGMKGTDNTDATADNHGHLVALIATDEYGKSAAHILRVIVNNPPVAHSAHNKEADQKTLGGVMDYIRNANVNLTGITPASLASIRLVDDSTTADMVEGYFSDDDSGDPLSCRYSTDGDEIFADTFPNWATTDPVRQVLNLAAADAGFNEKGLATVKVRCSDSFEWTPYATLTIDIDTDGSIH